MTQFKLDQPAQYCGASYGGIFVVAYETTAVDIPYDGPEMAKLHAREQAMFKEP